MTPRSIHRVAPGRGATDYGRRGMNSTASVMRPRPTAWVRISTLLLLIAISAATLSARTVAAQENGAIEGVVANGTAGAATPADVEVVVHVLQNRAKIGEHRVRTDGSGSFRLEGLTTGPATIYFPIVQYGGVPYYPDRPVTLDGTTPARTEITVFETVANAEAIAFDRLNMLVMDVTPTALTIMEMGAVTNSSDRTFAADPQVTGSARTLRFLLPPGAMQVTPQAGLQADSLESTADGFASTDPIRPGRREIAFSYELPYTSSTLDLARSFAFPVGTFTLYVPSDVGAVVPDAVALAGTAELGGKQFRQYAVQQVAPGTDVRLRLTGLPAPLFARPRDLGLAVVGVSAAFLIAFLVVALWRRRATPTHEAQMPPLPGVDPPAALGAERTALVRSVACLDEQFAAGAISEVEYRAERAKQKSRLLAVAQATVGP